MRMLHFQRMINSFKEKNRTSFSQSLLEEQRHERFNIIMNNIYTSIKDIDFNSFSLDDVEQLINHIIGMPTDDGFQNSREMMKYTHSNYFYINERTDYAIKRLINNTNKQYESTDDFI